MNLTREKHHNIHESRITRSFIGLYTQNFSNFTKLKNITPANLMMGIFLLELEATVAASVWTGFILEFKVGD
jgi:hypothetical protein